MSTFILFALGLPSFPAASTSPPSTPQLPASVVSAIILSVPSNLIFYKHHDLILDIPALQPGSYMSINIASTI